MKSLQEWLLNTIPEQYHDREHLLCKDGFRISVQASDYTYCAPRNYQGPWTHVECGYPSDKPEFILSYAEDPEAPAETVYGYVPIELVQKLLNHHGGFINEY